MDGAAQPLSFGQILDRTFRLCHANLKNFVVISLVPTAGLVITVLGMAGTLFLFLRPDRGTLQQMSALQITITVAVFVLGMIVLMVVYSIYQPAVSYAALQSNLGIQITPGDAYAKTWSNCGRYIGLTLLKALIVSGPTYGILCLVAAGFALRSRMGNGDWTGFLLVTVSLSMLIYVASMVYSVFMMIRLALAVPACVAEDQPVRAAIKRSFRLSRGAMGRIFLMGLVIYAIGCAAMMVFEVVAWILMAIGALIFALMHLDHVAQIVLGSIFGAFFMAGYVLLMGALWSAFSVSFTLIYHDQCLRIDPRPEPEPVA